MCFIWCPAPLFYNPRLIKDLDTVSFQIQETLLKLLNQSQWQQLIYIYIYIYIFIFYILYQSGALEFFYNQVYEH